MSASAAVGFVAMLLRQVPSTRLVFIAVQNSLIVMAVTCLYVGIARFLDARARRWLIGPILAVFFVTHLYFTWIVDNITVRGVVVSLTLAVMAFRLMAGAGAYNANSLGHPASWRLCKRTR